MHSLLAFWIGGAGTTSSAGLTSMLAPWGGGASAIGGVAPVVDEATTGLPAWLKKKLVEDHTSMREAETRKRYITSIALLLMK